MSPFQIPTHTTIEAAFIYYQSISNQPTYSITKNTTHTTKTTLWFQGTVDQPLPQKATVTFPHMSTILTPNHQFCFLTLCSTLPEIQQSNVKPFASNANCFALWYNHIWNFLHNTLLHIILTWIKEHADFDGNEHSDKISKWVSLHLPQHLENHNTDTSHFIYHNHTPVPGSITRKTVKHLLPSHKHNNIHLPSSTDFYAHTSWLSRLPFKWTNGLYCCTCFLPHYKLNTYHCPKCHTRHPLDPRTTVTECGTAKPIRDLFFEVWQQPFKQTVTKWWQLATRGERGNYIRTLIANSLSNALRDIPPNIPYFQHKQNLKTAFIYRGKRLKTALQEAQTWLRQNPSNDLHLLQPDSADNPSNNEYSNYSTSSHSPTLLTYPKRTKTTVANKHPHKHRHIHNNNKKTTSQLLNLLYLPT